MMAVIPMIILNGTEYKDYEIKVTYGKYRLHRNGNTIEGVSPFLSFCTDDFIVGIETTFDVNNMKELRIGEEMNISSYVSDFCFEDSKGWISLNDGRISCFLKRISEDKYEIHSLCKAEDGLDSYDIIIEDTIGVKFDE